jgi:predicted GH43/DUF377 family glycosyl hydrolase
MRFLGLKEYTQLLLCAFLSPLFPVKNQLLAYAKPIGTSPLLSLGKQSDWDSTYATWASVTREDNSWLMHYSGKDKAGHLRIGLALSQDGLKWTKYKDNPILDIGVQGSWDATHVYCPIVWKEANSWKMIFTGCSTHAFQVGLAISDDGISWKKSERNPIFGSCNSWTLNSWGKHETEGWGLFFDGHEYNLLYNPVTRRPRQIGLATSRDFVSWKELLEPILPSHGYPWELGYMKYCGHIFKCGENRYILSAVSNMGYSKSRIGLWRVSSLMHPREKQFLGYIVDTSTNWSEKEVDTPFVVEDAANHKVLCYYGGKSRRNNWYEGLVSVELEALCR